LGLPVTLDPGATYRIVSELSGNCVDVAGGSTAVGSELQIEPCSGSASQQFTVQAQSGGQYVVRNVNSGLCVDVPGASKAIQTLLDLNTCTTGTDEEWILNDLGGGKVTLTNQNSGLVWDVKHASTANGTPLQQYTLTGNANQQFQFQTLDAGTVTTPPPTPPSRLSQTGLFQSVASDGSLVLASGVQEYQPLYPLWADGASKDRWIYLPPGTRIDTSSQDHWKFPVGTKFWKEFSLNGQRLETRLLWIYGPGPNDYLPVSYWWNPASGINNDAQLADATLGEQDINGTTHDIPSQQDCHTCHDSLEEHVLGFGAIELNHALPGVNINTLIAAGTLTNDPTLAELAIPGDGTAQAALGYLHANCGICHNATPGGSGVPTSPPMLLRLSVGTAAVAQTSTYQTAVGVPTSAFTSWPYRIAGQDPADSAIAQAMSARGDRTQMPPLATKEVDTTAVAAITAWIDELPRVSSIACGTAPENSNVTLTCPAGMTITAIPFASYGTPTGSCGSYQASTCNAATSSSVVQSDCIGKTTCTVTANNATFTDPCKGTVKHMDVQATCTFLGTVSNPDAGSMDGGGTADAAVADSSNEDAKASDATVGGADSGADTGSSSPDAGTGPGYIPGDVLTNRYDNFRTGEQPYETVLNTSNVNSKTFGYLFSMSIDGKVYGQPLYVSGLKVNGVTHNVVYVATENAVVYAFDADNGEQLWSKTLEPPITLGAGGVFNPGCGDMSGGAASYVVGVTSTPVIDPTAGLIYVVNKTSSKHMLHALSLTTGQDVPAPVAVGPSGFDSNIQLNRPGLLLLNGTVYIGFGSHCDAAGYHGFIFGHDARTLALKVTYNTTPSGTEGAIWQGGVGLSSDGSNIWFAAGNGSTGGDNVGMSVVKASVSGSTLINAASHSEPADGDNDLSAGAVLVGNQVLSGGKSGYVIVLNASDASQSQILGAGGEVHNVAAWNGGSAGEFVYTWGTSAHLTQWQLSGGSLTNQKTNTEQSPGHPGGMVTVSSNGTAPGTAVLWANIPLNNDAWSGTSPGALYAFDASDVSKPSLWNSGQDTSTFGTYAKFSPPTTARGKVYVATFSGQVRVYGLK
jgi:hypothetical protein